MKLRTNLPDLPDKQREELKRSVGILVEEFERAVGRGTERWRRGGKIVKIILFGSYARGDWVDEPRTGYQSDFDLLIVVSHHDLTDIAEYWYEAEERILHDSLIERQVNIIVHDLAEVNEKLTRGEYFWADIARDGVVLYEQPPVHPLATPVPLTPAQALEMAEGYFGKWSRAIDRWLKLANVSIAEQQSDPDWLNNAAFNLHQATETAYTCFLLTKTLYVPRSHNIKFLRSLSEGREPRLIEAWPRATKLDRGRFQLLKRAYVEARYSPHYSISLDELDALILSVKQLRDLVGEVCQEWLEQLRQRAGSQ